VPPQRTGFFLRPDDEMLVVHTSAVSAQRNDMLFRTERDPTRGKDRVSHMGVPAAERLTMIRLFEELRALG
jgi:hypothetical protein